MPLLGRHKSPQGSGQSAHKSKQQQQQQQPSSSASPPLPLVCESPFFGVRRQLPAAGPATISEQYQRNNSGGNCSPSTPAHLPSSSKGSQSTGSTTIESSISHNGLSSIPKQISRQQIHYAFSIMDTNSDGLIDLRDLSQMLANLGVPIDEAILSHVMSTVSKRGDHLINESEFLDWIGNVIQVSDLLLPGDEHKVGATSSPSSSSGSGRVARKTPVGRSNSAAVSAVAAVASLAAHSPEAQVAIESQLRHRRGSGSGLALMRSLSSSAASPDRSTRAESAGGSGRTTAGPTTTPTGGSKKKGVATEAELQQLEQQQEACSDLKAAFCVFDLDGDGFITIDEVQQGLKLLGETWSAQELNQVFSRCSGGASKAAVAQDKKQSTKSSSKQQQQRAAEADLTSSKQRISIDDFVKLLL